MKKKKKTVNTQSILLVLSQQIAKKVGQAKKTAFQREKLS